MTRCTTGFFAAAILAALQLFVTFASPAMELVVFTSERSLLVEKCEEKEKLVVLTLLGGGQIGIPADKILSRYPGFLLPKEEEKPEKLLPASIPYKEIIARYCQQYEMDWKIVAAVIQVESAFNPRAVSPKGAQGLMQLMPSVQKEEGVTDAFDPDQNIRGGVHYLKKMLEACEGDLELGLAAYNAGLSRVLAKNAIPNITETKNYVAKILSIYPTY